MTKRDMLIKILNAIEDDDIDGPAKVVVLHREQEGHTVVHRRIVDVGRIDMHGNICIEESLLNAADKLP